MGARDHLCDPNPQTLAWAGEPSAPRSVEDQTFDTLDEALLAAHTQDPPANRDKWKSEWGFWWDFTPSEGDPHLSEQLGPEPETLGNLPTGIAIVAGVGLAWAVTHIASAHAQDNPTLSRLLADAFWPLMILLIASLLVIMYRVKTRGSRSH